MATVVGTPRTGWAIGATLLLGDAVAIGLGLYAHEHTPKPKPLFLAGFSGAIQFKVWFASVAFAFILAQLVSALWMWQRLPGAGRAPAWVAPVHRWSGTIAFVLLIPVVLNCLYSLGWSDASRRTLVHCVAGCVFYGAYCAKMLGLRLRGLPSWAIPLFGGLVFASFIVLWSTSAGWFFSTSGRPLT
jgi:hypothetical protein